ncbi:hypothetical protein [Rhodococcus pyridinivorans]|uniref:Uncharacterized protein n=1 Tax=Rhodococcus pyridinivorans TaxID=103816 RepID=A0A7M2XNZ4_9NOCA|nr:hypothetical protein [Rhodococcus pyridinivorans]QOV99544.1 hypothetical protein INP59_03845 [Rhodococcus pyridinivorans]
MTTTEVPVGINWRREGNQVVGTVIAVPAPGQHETLATVRYTLDQAAEVVGHLIEAIGGKR